MITSNILCLGLHKWTHHAVVKVPWKNETNRAKCAARYARESSTSGGVLGEQHDNNQKEWST